MTAPRFSIAKHRGPLAEGGSRTDAQSHDPELTRPRPGEEARMTDEFSTTASGERCEDMAYLHFLHSVPLGLVGQWGCPGVEGGKNWRSTA
jgi:hypothetical protein